MGFQNNAILTDGASASARAYQNPQPPASSTAHKVKAGGDPVVQFKQLGGEAALARASDAVGGENLDDYHVTGEARVLSDGELVGRHGGTHGFQPEHGKEYTMLSDQGLEVKTTHSADDELSKVRVVGDGFEIVLEEAKIIGSPPHLSPNTAKMIDNSVSYKGANGESYVCQDGWSVPGDKIGDDNASLHFEDHEGGRRAVITTPDYDIVVDDPSTEQAKSGQTYGLALKIVAKDTVSDGVAPTGILGSTFEQDFQSGEENAAWKEIIDENAHSDTNNFATKLGNDIANNFNKFGRWCGDTWGKFTSWF